MPHDMSEPNDDTSLTDTEVRPIRIASVAAGEAPD